MYKLYSKHIFTLWSTSAVWLVAHGAPGCESLEQEFRSVVPVGGACLHQAGLVPLGGSTEPHGAPHVGIFLVTRSVQHHLSSCDPRTHNKHSTARAMLCVEGCLNHQALKCLWPCILTILTMNISCLFR